VEYVSEMLPPPLFALTPAATLLPPIVVVIGQSILLMFVEEVD